MSAFELGAFGVAIALAAVFAARRDPWAVRLAGLIAVVIAWLASADRVRSVFETVPPHVIAIGTGSASLDDLAERVRRVDGARFEHVVGSGDLDRDLLVAAARVDVDTAEVVFVWTDPFEPRPQVSGLLLADRVLTRAVAPPIEPGDLEVRTIGPLRADRPAALELRATRELPAGIEVNFEVRNEDGAVVARETVPSEELVVPREVALGEVRAGAYQLQLSAGRLKARGGVRVVEAPRIGVHGKGAKAIAGALAVQGLTVGVLEAPVADLEEYGVIVVLDELEPEVQLALRAYVDDGGGLLVVGGVDGGALPQPGEPLHEWMPVEVLPMTEAQPVADGSSGSAGDDPNPDAPPPDEPPPPDAPPPDAPPPETLPRDGESIGDVGDARKPDEGSTPQPVERRDIALVLVIDQSASMAQIVSGGASRMDFAKRSAFETARALEATDDLGIVAFDRWAYDVIPLDKRPGEVGLRAALTKLDAIGRETLLEPGLARAREMLRNSRKGVKHAILLTDSDSLSLGDLGRTAAVAKRMAREGVTVSVVLVSGPGGSVRASDLQPVVAQGGGELHFTRDAESVPRVILAEVQRVLGGAGRGDGNDPAEPESPAPPEPEPPPTEPEPEPEPPPDEPPPPPSDDGGPMLDVRAISDSRLVEPVPDLAYPQIGGVAPAAGRTDAQTLFVAGDDGTPLLAVANRGLGRIAAWTADFTGPWGAAWRAEPAFPARLAQWVEYLGPAAIGAPPDAVVRGGTIEPPAPTRAELAALVARSRADVEDFDAWIVPETREVERREGRAPDDSLFALATLLALALIEWLARRVGR